MNNSENLFPFPSHWQTKAIKEFAKVKGGKRLPRGASLIQTKTAHPYIRIVDFKNGRVDKSNLMYVPDDIFPLISRYVISKDDVYISIVGTVGLVGVIDDELDGANLTENAAKICEINDAVVDRNFLAAYLQSDLGQREIMAQTVGSTQPKLALFRIGDIRVPVPPLPEQRAIAAVLGALDDKIELNRRMNRTLEAIAQAVFRHWFVENEEAEGWEVGRLGDVAENIRRSASTDEIEPETHYIGLEHMPRGSITLSEWENASELASNKFIFREGEFLFGKLRPYFHKVGIAPIDGVCSTDILVIAPKSPEWYGFVLGHLSSEDLIAYTSAASTGTKMPRTNWADIADYEVTIPPLEKAKEFTEIFLPMAQRIRTNILESRTLAALRDALLPKLLRGEVRVTVHE